MDRALLAARVRATTGRPGCWPRKADGMACSDAPTRTSGMSIEAARVATARPARANDQRAVDQPASAPSPRRPWARRGLVGGAAIAALLLLVLAPPDVDELAEVPTLVAGGDPVWLAAALVFEVLSFAG